MLKFVVNTDNFDKVFSSYNLTTKTAVLKNSELYDENALIFIHTTEYGNWVFIKGHLYGSPDNSPLPYIDWKEVKQILSEEDTNLLQNLEEQQ